MFTQEQILAHNTMFTHYQNKEILDFINKFFSIKKGLRPMVIQARNPGKPPIRYIPANTHNMILFHDFNYDQLKNMTGQIHFIECIFSKEIRNKELINNEINKLQPKQKLKEVFNPLIIGISPCIEIDVKTDIFKSFDKAIYLKCLIEKNIEDMGFKSNSIFSGNGIYTIMESYYFDEKEDNMTEMFETLSSFMEDINKKMKKKYKDNKASIDTQHKFWSKYFKSPFTYHNKWNRITLPLSNGEINKEWLKEVCNIDNIIQFKEIIKEANWKSIW